MMESNSGVDASIPHGEGGAPVSIDRPSDAPTSRRDPDGRGPRGLRLLAFISCFIAGVVAWGLGETSLVRVEAKRVPVVTMGNEHLSTTSATERTAQIATAARGSAVLGAVLGLAMAAVAGWSRRSKAGALTALAGAALGGVAGGLAARYAVTLRTKGPSFEDDLVTSMIMHGAIAIVIGVVAALALGLGIGRDGTRGRRVRLLLGGGAGALLGALAFQIVGGLMFPIDGTADPISATSLTRFLSLILVSTFTAIGAAEGLLDRGPRGESKGSGHDPL